MNLLSSKKVVAGLGNPGKKYINTRHNLGYKTVEFLVKEYKRKFKADTNNLIELCELKVYNQILVVLKSLTYMNLSGKTIGNYVLEKDIELENFLIVYDDIDTPCGEIKLKPYGGSGGHRGLESIIRFLGSNKFPRLKIGISHPGNSDIVSNYVLDDIKDEEKIFLVKSIEKAKEAIKFWVKFGLIKTMSKFN